MKKILPLVLLILLCCFGMALAEEGVNPYFAQARPIPLPARQVRSVRSDSQPSMIEGPLSAQTGDTCTYTAEPGHARYRFYVLILDEEEYVLYYTYMDRYDTESNTLTWTYYEPGTFYIQVYAENESGSVSYDEIFVQVTGENYKEQKIRQIVADCPAGGEYETALWLHDYLINHAYYDYSYTRYGADGVLMDGYGVCDSYSTAYQLLLSEAGIQSRVVVSTTHAWNAVLIDGEWTNIDCTFDDPGSSHVASSGNEIHTFFGLPNEIMFKIDEHVPRSNYTYPDCTSYASNYTLRNDELPWHSAVEASVLEKLNDGQTSFSIELSHQFTDYDGSVWGFLAPALSYGLSCYKLSSTGVPYRGRTMVFDADCDLDNDPWIMNLVAHYQWDKTSELIIHAAKIEEEAFQGVGAAAVVIDGACERIETRCFADMPNLDRVRIPASVVYIADDAFLNAPENLLVVAAKDSAAETFAAEHGYCLEIIEPETP